MPASSSSESRVVCNARSSPSHSGTNLPLGMLFEETSAAPERMFTSSTSQSAQRVNPCRYSTLHCGQYMTGVSLLQFRLVPGLAKTCFLAVQTYHTHFPLHYLLILCILLPLHTF